MIEDWMIGGITTVLLALIGVVNGRVSKMGTRLDSVLVDVAHIRETLSGLAPTVKVAVLEALREHEDKEDMKFEKLHDQMSSLDTKVGILGSDITRLCNGRLPNVRK